MLPLSPLTRRQLTNTGTSTRQNYNGDDGDKTQVQGKTKTVVTELTIHGDNTGTSKNDNGSNGVNHSCNQNYNGSNGVKPRVQQWR